ncbi:hypothetical protein MSAN_01369400 [Mycena sanguinolenta]|uniref:Uncharacterized protein n=1 Tax=Mycena sanguinolenta TaxID=230812 RepID=A0A8H6Y7B7_9AGAR|nr:hypothetical protein MSAN_01369400 [Mycena sanguinolenta]
MTPPVPFLENGHYMSAASSSLAVHDSITQPVTDTAVLFFATGPPSGFGACPRRCSALTSRPFPAARAGWFRCGWEYGDTRKRHTSPQAGAGARSGGRGRASAEKFRRHSRSGQTRYIGRLRCFTLHPSPTPSLAVRFAVDSRAGFASISSCIFGSTKMLRRRVLPFARAVNLRVGRTGRARKMQSRRFGRKCLLPRRLLGNFKGQCERISHRSHDSSAFQISMGPRAIVQPAAAQAVARVSLKTRRTASRASPVTPFSSHTGRSGRTSSLYTGHRRRGIIH